MNFFRHFITISTSSLSLASYILSIIIICLKVTNQEIQGEGLKKRGGTPTLQDTPVGGESLSHKYFLSLIEMESLLI